MNPTLARDRIKTNGLISHFIASPPGGPGYFITLLRSYSKLLSPKYFVLQDLRSLGSACVLLYQFIRRAMLSVLISLEHKIGNLDQTSARQRGVISRHNN